jgi:hypothetical protein
MQKRTPKTAEEATAYAQEWQQWQAEQSLSYSELAEWQAEFERIGKEFDLTDEFRENGII